MRRAMILMLVVGVAVSAFGYGSYVSKIPNGGAFSCDNCHMETGFKNDFKDNGNQWNGALATKDSDGDRASNGVELQDPQGNWRPSQPDPKVNGWNTYNPGNKNSTPPYAPVAPASWGRVKVLFK